MPATPLMEVDEFDRNRSARSRPGCAASPATSGAEPSGPRSANNLHVSAYAARRRAAGSVRTNLVLSPDDLAMVGRLMAIWGTTREEAIRSAIRIAAKTLSASPASPAERPALPGDDQ